METLEANGNHMVDNALGKYYDALKLITRGPLWSMSRFNAIFSMNVGAYDYLIDGHRYRYPAMQRLTLTAVAPKDGDGPSERRYAISKAGLEVSLGGSVHAPGLSIEAEHSEGYRVYFLRMGVRRGITNVEAPTVEGTLSSVARIRAPLEKMPGGYDAIRIVPKGKDGSVVLRWLALQ